MDNFRHTTYLPWVAALHLFVILGIVTKGSSAYGSSECGSIPNNPATTICCNGLVYVRSGAQPGCCGNVGYDARNYLCCSGNRVRKDQFKVARCCGSQGYDQLKGNCVAGNMVQKKSNLGSHCCMTDNGWKCCNKGEGCCTYSGSGQVEITGFRPVCCEKRSFREKAECCANTQETTGVLPSCCQQQDLKPRCCKRSDGSQECCSVFESCCTNSYNSNNHYNNDIGGSNNNNNYGSRRGVPIRRNPARQTPDKPKPTQLYNYRAYYDTTTRKTPKIPQCCLSYYNRPSCCYSLQQSPNCCNSGSSRHQQNQNSRQTGNQVTRTQQPQRNRNSCCTITRRTCCPKIKSPRVSKVVMQPCCYSVNKPNCCYTSQAYNPDCCRSAANRQASGQSNYIPPDQRRDRNQALEVRYSNSRGYLPGQSGNMHRGVPIKLYGDSEIKTENDVSNRQRGAIVNNRQDYYPGYSRGSDRTRSNGQRVSSGSNRWADRNENKYNGNRNAAINTVRPNEIDSGRMGSNGWSEDRDSRQNNNQWLTQDRDDKHNVRKTAHIKHPQYINRMTTTTSPRDSSTSSYAEDLPEAGGNQNDVMSYEHCCYLADRRGCCKEAYLATGTLPYCCSASIEKDNMGAHDDLEWGSKQLNVQTHDYPSKIKIAKPEAEPKFIPDYAPFGHNNGYVISGMVSEISPNEIPGFDNIGRKQEVEARNNMPGIIKAIIVDSHSRTTEPPRERETERYNFVTEKRFTVTEIPVIDIKNDNSVIVDNDREDYFNRINNGGSQFTDHKEYPSIPTRSNKDLTDYMDREKGLDNEQVFDNIDDGKVTKYNSLSHSTTTTDTPVTEKERHVPIQPTIHTKEGIKNPSDPVDMFPRPYLNDSIYIPSNLIGKGGAGNTIQTKDNLPPKLDENIESNNPNLNSPEWKNKDNIPFEYEYQQPDTLDNPFPYIPSSKDAGSKLGPNAPTKEPTGDAIATVPDFDSLEPGMRPDVYNYYMEGAEYPEYMMCGDEPYMMSVYICCDSVLRYRYGVRPRCCGTEAYDDFTYKCCDGIIMRSCQPGNQPNKLGGGGVIVK